MTNEQKILLNEVSARKEYSAPGYQFLTFETSGLIQASGGRATEDPDKKDGDPSIWG